MRSSGHQPQGGGDTPPEQHHRAGAVRSLRDVLFVVAAVSILLPSTARAEGPSNAFPPEAVALASAIATMVAIDVYLALDGKRGNTWSEITRSWGSQTLAVPWALGVVSGHLFHPFELKRAQPWETAALVGLTVTIALVSTGVPKPIPRWMQAVSFGAGLVSGALLWEF